MTVKRKVRKDFDLTKEYSVDVEDCTEKEKEEVQQGFFDVGILWDGYGAVYQYLDDVVQYSNTHYTEGVGYLLLYGGTTKGCNMTAKEFLELVYEPEQQGHVHAELMALYAEDANTIVKTKTHIVSGVEIPDLRIKEEPKPDTMVVCVNPLERSLFSVKRWKSDEMYLRNYQRLLKLGFLYEYTIAGQEAAILHTRAIMGWVRPSC